MNRLNFDHKLAIAIIIVVASIAGIFYILFIPTGPYVSDKDRAVFSCVFLCKAAENEGLVLDSGPCLSSGESGWELEEWVCDVAHNPRIPEDNLPQNQCPEFGRTASHFVEVNPNCIFLRAV